MCYVNMCSCILIFVLFQGMDVKDDCYFKNKKKKTYIVLIDSITNKS